MKVLDIFLLLTASRLPGVLISEVLGIFLFLFLLLGMVVFFHKETNCGSEARHRLRNAARRLLRWARRRICRFDREWSCEEGEIWGGAATRYRWPEG